MYFARLFAPPIVFRYPQSVAMLMQRLRKVFQFRIGRFQVVELLLEAQGQGNFPLSDRLFQPRE